MNHIPKWITNEPIAHRGLHSNDSKIPENSLKSFKNAIDNGFPIELDIHLLKDNKVVVFHDDNLIRMCGVNTRVNDLSSNELNKYKLLNSDEKIPLLEEVFELVNGRVPILIEIKSSNENKKIHLPLLSLIKDYDGEIAIQSFNPFLLKWYASNVPEIIRGQLSSSFKGEKMNIILKLILRAYRLNFLSKPNFIAHDITDLKVNRRIQNFRKKNIPILGWTVRSKEESEDISSHCDNIIFENFFP